MEDPASDEVRAIKNRDSKIIMRFFIRCFLSDASFFHHEEHEEHEGRSCFPKVNHPQCESKAGTVAPEKLHQIKVSGFSVQVSGCR